LLRAVRCVVQASIERGDLALLGFRWILRAACVVQIERGDLALLGFRWILRAACVVPAWVPATVGPLTSGKIATVGNIRKFVTASHR